MEEKKVIKLSLSTFFLILALIVIVVMAIFMYKFYIEKIEANEKSAQLQTQVSNLNNTVSNLQGKIDSVSNIVIDTKNEKENIKVEIPEASRNITDKEEKIISNYFKGVWTTSNGEKILAVDYGKRFCEINSSNNSKEYGTYTVKDGTASSEPTITLNYKSGKTLTLKLSQAGTSYLISDDVNVQYVKYEGYYFGSGEGDEGIFDDDKSIPSASTNITDKEEKTISNYFKGIWTTSNGEKILAVDYGKRFCEINSSNNSKEYGTYTVKDGTASSEPTITLTYKSGKTLTLKLAQGGTSYLISNDGKVQYVNCDAYYLGASEGDEGIFNK